jgi:cbb3-type cytochrome oxidase maturation protein
VDSLYFLIPIAIVFVSIAVKVFFWAVNNGQYDDLNTEGRRILFDDDAPDVSASGGNQTDDAEDAGQGTRNPDRPEAVNQAEENRGKRGE